MSFGQRQLFCLARAVLKRAICLVLDESTSNLDSETEKQFLECCNDAFKGKTVITIAVRLEIFFLLTNFVSILLGLFEGSDRNDENCLTFDSSFKVTKLSKHPQEISTIYINIVSFLFFSLFFDTQHRLYSLLDYDRVVIMENGKIIEDGNPKELKSNPKSVFTSMLNASDLSNKQKWAVLMNVQEKAKAPKWVKRVGNISYHCLIKLHMSVYLLIYSTNYEVINFINVE